MPVTDFHFADGIFYAREYGRLDERDALQWAEQAAHYAHLSPQPIAALVDARELVSMTAAARHVFAQASAIQGLYIGAIVTQNFHIAQSAHFINKLSVDKHTVVFDDMQEAERFLKRKLTHLHPPASASSAS